MKRFTLLIALLAMMSLMVFGLAACGGSDEAAPAEEAVSTSTAEQSSTEAEDTAATEAEQSTEVEVPDISEEDIQAAADQAAEESGITDSANVLGLYGNWVGESFEYNDMTMSLEDAGMTFSIEFKIDGTATAMTNGEGDGSATFTINDDNTITLKDGSGELPDHSYIDDDGLLHLGLNAEDGTMWIICHKE